MNEKPESGEPASMDDGWPVSPPDHQGMDGELLEGIPRQFGAWTEANVHAVLIARSGTLVCEHYFAGEDWAFAEPLGRIDHDASMRHDIRSITKSVTSLLVGIAFDRGWLDDVDQSVFSFFPEHTDLRTPEKDQITLYHLLTMSPGFAWSEDLPYSNPKNSERRMIDAPDQHRYVLEQPLARPPGATYTYNGGTTALLAEIVRRASGRTLEDVAAAELFEPLGITDVEWVRYTNGDPMAASGLRLRPRDLAKIGHLVLSRGDWRGNRVVSEDWITQSTTPHVNGQSLFFYGYQWWLGRSLVNRREITWVSAVGWGGQRMYIVPSLDLIVTVLAGLYQNPVLQPIVGEIVLRRYALPAALNH